MLKFLGKYVYKMQLYLRPFYNFLRQRNSFEWTTEHQTRVEEIKNFSQNKSQTQFQTPISHFMQSAMLRILALEQHYYNLSMEQKK